MPTIPEGVLAWWVGQLLSSFRGWVPGNSTTGDTLVAEQSPSGLTVSSRKGGADHALGFIRTSGGGAAGLPARFRNAPVSLRIPESMLLRRDVTLPIAAERNLSQILTHDLDRLTPFDVNDMYWTWSVLQRNRARGHLRVALFLVPRKAVDHAIDLLQRESLTPAALEAADGQVTIPLITAGRSNRVSRTLLRAAALACVSLLLAAFTLPFAQQIIAGQRIERRIAALKPQVDRADRLRRTIAGVAAGANVIAAQQAEVGDPLTVLALVTDALPDGTFLRELLLRGRVVTISGQSANAARLIPALAATDRVQDPAFTGPLTRNEAAAADVFTIRATVSH